VGDLCQSSYGYDWLNNKVIEFYVSNEGASGPLVGYMIDVLYVH